MLWRKKKHKQAKLSQMTIEEYIHLFAVRNSYYGSNGIVEIDNIRFTIQMSYRHSVKIHLVDGEDELLVYEGFLFENKKSQWLHKGAWSDKILQIVRDDYEREEQAKKDEINRLKDKFGKIFSGNKGLGEQNGEANL
ncbi:hypothetical protein M5X00_25925 [Paenibacillus alvei]|uniref:hypothetical protein n=1 Tax=Paenibacillus alvei TaxID=44250 RepID=UPI002280A36C|nr:hypothetical protein [Paenibacillus alvei]MCY9757669.1 hypothetical protein [Paenibacillus alvei]